MYLVPILADPLSRSAVPTGVSADGDVIVGWSYSDWMVGGRLSLDAIVWIYIAR